MNMLHAVTVCVALDKTNAWIRNCINHKNILLHWGQIVDGSVTNQFGLLWNHVYDNNWEGRRRRCLYLVFSIMFLNSFVE
jgi:hypothetical protein